MGIQIGHIMWQTVSKCLTNCDSDCHVLQEDANSNLDESTMQMRLAFANSGKEEEIYPLTVTEIADAQKADKFLRKLFKHEGEKSKGQQYQVSIIEDTRILTDERLRMVIPKPLQKKAVQWYYHYLQHPGHTRLEETLRATMTFPGLCDLVRRHTKYCRSCQFNKRRKLQYGKLPEK